MEREQGRRRRRERGDQCEGEEEHARRTEEMELEKTGQTSNEIRGTTRRRTGGG